MCTPGIESLPDILTAKQLAAFLKLSPKSVYKLLHNGEIVSIRAGKSILIPKAHVLAYLKIPHA